VGDLHEVVVDYVGKVIGGQFVGTLIEHLIVEDIGLDAHLATDKVVDEDFLTRFDHEAHHILLTISYELVNLSLREGEGVAHLEARARVVLKIRYLIALGLEFFRGIEGNVGFAGIEELLDILLVNLATLALAVGAFVATERDAFIELYAEPTEGFEDVLLGTRDETVGIGILDAEDELATMLTSEKIIV
jgi:hypothetical protein